MAQAVVTITVCLLLASVAGVIGQSAQQTTFESQSKAARLKWLTHHHFALCSTPEGSNPRLVICQPGFSARIYSFKLKPMNFSGSSRNHCRGRTGSGTCTNPRRVEKECLGKHICILPQNICRGSANQALEMKYTCMAEKIKMCSNETLGRGIQLKNGRITNRNLLGTPSLPCQCTISSSSNIIVDVAVSNNRTLNCGKADIRRSQNLMTFYAETPEDMDIHPVHTVKDNISSCVTDSFQLEKPDAITTHVFAFVLNHQLQKRLTYNVLFDTIQDKPVTVRCVRLSNATVAQQGGVAVDLSKILIGMDELEQTSDGDNQGLTTIQIICLVAGLVTVIIVILVVMVLYRNKKKKAAVQQILAVDQVYNNTQSSDSQCYYEIIPNQIDNPVQPKRENSRKIYVVNIINTSGGEQEMQQYFLPANSEQAEVLLQNLTKNVNTGSERIMEAITQPGSVTQRRGSENVWGNDSPKYHTRSDKFVYKSRGVNDNSPEESRRSISGRRYRGDESLLEEAETENHYDDIGNNDRSKINDAFLDDEENDDTGTEMAKAWDMDSASPVTPRDSPPPPFSATATLQSTATDTQHTRANGTLPQNGLGENDELGLTINIYSRGGRGSVKGTVGRYVNLPSDGNQMGDGASGNSVLPKPQPRSSSSSASSSPKQHILTGASTTYGSATKLERARNRPDVLVSGKLEEESNYLELLQSMADHPSIPQNRVTKAKSSAVGERPPMHGNPPANGAPGNTKRSQSSTEADRGVAAVANRIRLATLAAGKWRQNPRQLPANQRDCASSSNDGVSRPVGIDRVSGCEPLDEEETYLEPQDYRNSRRTSSTLEVRSPPPDDSPPPIPSQPIPSHPPRKTRRKEYHTVGGSESRRKPPPKAPSSKSKSQLPPKEAMHLDGSHYPPIATKPRSKTTLVKSSSDSEFSQPVVKPRASSSPSSKTALSQTGSLTPETTADMKSRALPLTPQEVEAVYSHLY